jgi:hypothetical protein
LCDARKKVLAVVHEDEHTAARHAFGEGEIEPAFRNVLGAEDLHDA